MSGEGIDASCCQGSSADCVDERVENHERSGGGACCGGDGLGCGETLTVQEEEDERVDQDGGEHCYEDPEVVEPEAFDGILLTDPALWVLLEV